MAGEVTVAPSLGLETVSGNDEPGGGGGSGAGGAGSELAGVQIGVGEGDGAGLGDGEALGWGAGEGVGPPAICETEPLPQPATKASSTAAEMIVETNWNLGLDGKDGFTAMREAWNRSWLFRSSLLFPYSFTSPVFVL